VQSIAQTLHATHVIEGSVRKDGNEVRITAQLIRADNGTHLWTESYNRELKGVFAIQEEIATAIAASLRVPLGLKKSETLVSNRTEDTASYQDYLRAKALFRLRGLKSLTDATNLLEQVVTRDPGYAPAWALMSLAYELTPNFHPAFISGDIAATRRVFETSLPRAEAAARRAIALDSKLADGYEALALVQAQRGKLLEAEELYLKALALDSNDPDTLHQYSQILAEVGRWDETLAMRERLQTLEPLVPIYNMTSAILLRLNGQNDAAIKSFRDFPADFAYGKIFLSETYAALGRFGDAANTLSEIPPQAFLPGTVTEAVRLLRSAPAAAAAPQRLPRLGILEFVYLHVGAANRVLEYQEGNIEAGGYIYPVTVWTRDLAALLRCMPRATDGSPGPQMLHELLFQHAAGLHIEATIDGLVRHLAGLGPWIRPLQPTRDLLGRPIAFQLCRNSLPQLAMLRQLTRLRAQRLFPCPLVGGCGAAPSRSAIAANLPANRRRRAPQCQGHRTHRPARHKATGYLFTLCQCQREPGPSPRGRSYPAADREVAENAGRRLAKYAPNRLQAFAPFPTLPELCALPRGKSNTIIRSPHAHRSTTFLPRYVLRRSVEITREIGHSRPSPRAAGIDP
jgi:tetratricopeptide (TPR) repeat protein